VSGGPSESRGPGQLRRVLGILFRFFYSLGKLQRFVARSTFNAKMSDLRSSAEGKTTGLRWRKTRRGERDGDCVEVACAAGTILIRGAKDPYGAVVQYSRRVCAAFLGLRRGADSIWSVSSFAAVAGLPATGWVALGLLPGQRLGTHPCVLGQRPDRGVTGARHQHGRPGAVLGVMRERRVPEPVQCGATGGLGEQRRGPAGRTAGRGPGRPGQPRAAGRGPSAR
jgi:hypothetical protein